MNYFLGCWWAGVILVMAFVACPIAGADPVPFLTGAGTTFASNGAFTLGFQIIVGSAPEELTALGVWDEGSDGLSAAHAVGIWGTNTTTPLAQATVPAGTGATLIDGYRFVNLSMPIELAANTTYVLGAAYNSDDTARDITTFSFAGRNSYASPGVTLGLGEFNFGSALSDPAGADVSTIYNGPNGLFTSVPEPVSLGMLLLTACALGRRHRK